MKPTIVNWPQSYGRKTDVLLILWLILASKLTHKHVLFRDDAPMFPQYCFQFLTIHHLLTDCPGLRICMEFNYSSMDLLNITGEKPH